MPQRYLSPPLREQSLLSEATAPLVGVESRMYNDLLNAIIDRKLRAGAKLEEVVLAELYGVSRTVTRKVLVIMEQEGVVSLPMNRGAYVALPSPRDAEELCELTGMFGAHIVDKLTSDPAKINAEHRLALAAHLDAEKAAEAEHDFHSARRLHLEYGVLLAFIHGNRILASSFDREMMRLGLALSVYQEGPLSGIGSEYTAKLNGLLLSGSRTEALKMVSDLGRTFLKSMRFDLPDKEPDLRTILGNG